MLRSLSFKIAAVGFVTAVSLCALAALLMTSSREMERGFAWVEHTRRVMELTSRPVDLVRQAESELRGALINADPAFAADAPAMLEQADRDLAELVRLTRDNPVQHERARALRAAVRVKIAFLQEGIAYSRADAYSKPSGPSARARNLRGRELMQDVDARRLEMLNGETALVRERSAMAEELFAANRHLVVIGVPAIMLLILSMKIFMVLAIRRPTRAMIGAMEAFDAGNTEGRLAIKTIKASEFGAIAERYNALADRLGSALDQQRVSEEQLHAANLELQERSAALETRSAVVQKLGLMAHRMHAARSDEEFAAIIGRFVPQILPGLSGTVYGHNNSRNHLVQIASWGDVPPASPPFEPEECWALRLGQPHDVTNPDLEISCSHTKAANPYVCVPLLAGGEVIGLIHLEGVLSAEDRFRLDALREDVASALVNHKLQRDLREQTIRDPLTGLFNRRYLEESLNVEIARAARGVSPLAVIMCDVDHFKRFNDEHGHDAGDAVLKAVASEMSEHFRDGDVICRYGGEEFTILALNATPEVIAARVERLRSAITRMHVRVGHRQLSATSMSFGIATYTAGASADGPTLLQMADEALYRAKREGRNRAVIAERLAA